MAIYGLDHKKKNRKPVRRKPGVVPKDDDISIRPGDTSNLSREEKRAAASEKARIEREIRQKEKQEAELAETINRYNEKIKEAKRKAGLLDEEEPEMPVSSKMLSDMRWVYSQVDGRQKLLKMVKGDEKQFAFMIKELIKFESALAEQQGARARNGEGGGGFFVVIKGLADENRLKSAMDGYGNEISNQRIAFTVTDQSESENGTAAHNPVVNKPIYKPIQSDTIQAPAAIHKNRADEDDW